MFNLPRPHSTLGRAIERALIAGLIAIIGSILVSGQVAEGSLAYFVVKTLIDLLNRNVDNL